MSLIRDGLVAIGYLHQHVGADAPGNTLLVATRQPSARMDALQLPMTQAHRCVHVQWQGMTMTGVYFAQGIKKVPLFEYLLSLPDSVVGGRALLLGDFNTGRHHLDEGGATFIVPEYLDRLEARGWVDVWRRLHPDAREYSWFSHAGNGFRIDHAFCSGPLMSSIRTAEYSHREREQGISDHSVLTLECDLGDG